MYNDNKLKEICKIANIKDIGDLSDGYHTFNQLYHQRAVLFATIVNQNKDISWKSFKDSDGKYCFDSNGEWFIVGIDTPEGSYTYHYEKSYWDIFKCQELECSKEWDGHTEEDVTRLLSLEQKLSTDMVSQKIDEFKLNGKIVEIWIVKGKLQIRYLGVIHNIPLSLVISQSCEDYISRQAVLSYISNELGFGNEENGYDLERKIAQEEIYNFVKKM